MASYTLERDGQLDFYNRFLPRINLGITIDEILADNTDGVLNGNLLEFKLNISDLNAVLFQAIKYLSAMRVKGKPIPANILLVDLNAGTAWLYHSAPYLAHIESYIPVVPQRIIAVLSVETLLKHCIMKIIRLTPKL